ncbi:MULTISPECIES: App1 family protein [Kocuria]|uniref:App1 family protein n=1 Tax=Kocuria TaxID=57493 RepID=UPI0022E6BB07|nr:MULTISPECIES: phosphatase domain-containing protein [Kocuria]
MAKNSGGGDLLQTVDQVTEEAINIAYRFDQKLQRWRQGRAVQRGDIPTMLAFDGYGSPRYVRALGRVLLKTRSLIEDTDDAAESIRGWRSFTSVPFAFAHVNVWLGEHEFHLVADKGGVIDVDLKVSMTPGVHTIYMQAEGSEVTEAKVAVVSDEQHLGVVCDVDDTVMVTALPRPMLAAWNSFVANEHARIPTPGMSTMMDRLRRSHPHAPFLYLSTGAWNVAPTLRRFLTRNAYPAGALLLTDWGPTTERWFRSGSQHKVQNLQRLARNFPHVRWILIGDDGQHDPQIYSGFAQRHPDSVAAIVIRNLSPTEAVLAAGTRASEGHHVTVPEGTLWIEANDGASISDQLKDAGLL